MPTEPSGPARQAQRPQPSLSVRKLSARFGNGDASVGSSGCVSCSWRLGISGLPFCRNLMFGEIFGVPSAGGH
eukprot:scaffold101501_cov42-Phaeocystis_antarctica.AAC.2